MEGGNGCGDRLLAKGCSPRRHVRGLRAAAAGRRPPGGPGPRGDGDRPRAAAGSKCGREALPDPESRARSSPFPEALLPVSGFPTTPALHVWILEVWEQHVFQSTLINSQTFPYVAFKKHGLVLSLLHSYPEVGKLMSLSPNPACFYTGARSKNGS